MFDFFLIFCAVFISISSQYHPLSQEYIAWINRNQTNWKAGRNFNVSEWSKVKNMASGAWKNPTTIPPFNRQYSILKANIPEHFDARRKWPKCQSINHIWDQSHCGSCWAVSAASTMSDRICIHSNQTLQYYISPEDLLSCCWECGKGCLGGGIPRAWWYWETYGIVIYSCRPYSLPPCEHHFNKFESRPHCDDLRLNTPICLRKCYNSSLDYQSSLTYGGRVQQFTSEEEIQFEIMQNGPVEGAIDIFDDFFNYKSGVYIRTSDKYIGGHAIEILGWGIENKIEYWLCSNSWNSDWGDGGYFRILRGHNHCGIEDQVFASLPRI
ncbi:unnamed protein product [Ceutorhynchus assimilis]|uniref:Peptidase C1A papain C-terminal domain-containing protein n=1 Tax=Ceutorhynchus assimilis TaxID=467358 RepID=A0A9N9N010_9CUCU|nr:unnamed protein product [Ceutorhynchus assimilis]